MSHQKATTNLTWSISTYITTIMGGGGSKSEIMLKLKQNLLTRTKTELGKMKQARFKLCQAQLSLKLVNLTA